jgi:hypothetical protein
MKPTVCLCGDPECPISRGWEYKGQFLMDHGRFPTEQEIHEYINVWKNPDGQKMLVQVSKDTD